MDKKRICELSIIANKVIIRDTPDDYRTIIVQDWIDSDESLEGKMGY